MFEYIKGKISKLAPTYVVIETGGLGYFIQISLSTFSQLEGKQEVTLLLHAIYREDAQQLYGFLNDDERELFRLLLTVSGVGANTARMMLSSMRPDEIIAAIINAQVSVLKSIKGIGLRTAERIIVDLKDKVKSEGSGNEIFAPADNTTRDEALSALTMLGFQKKAIEKAVGQILKKEPGLSVEEIIKQALKRL